MKKVFAAFLAVVLCFGCFALTAGADFNAQTEVTEKLVSDIYYMISLDDGTVLFSKNETKKTAPAAFVKLLAAITAIENWGNLDKEVEITEESLSLVTYDYGVRTVNLQVGETYTKRQLIEALMVYGANDCASVIAHNISGSVEGFAKAMNELAKKIGCNRTKIVNITGFDDDGQCTSAQDIATILKYALNSPVFSEAFSASSITLPATQKNGERTYNSENRMTSAATQDYYHSAVNGGKYTSTTKAGECIAVSSSQDGYSYLTVVMRGSMKDVDSDGVNENTCMTDAKQLLSWVYSNIRFRVIATANQIVAVVNVVAGKDADSLRLVPEKETSALVPAKATNNSMLIKIDESTLPKEIKAPVSAGQVICQGTVYFADQPITTINLVAANDVGLSLVRLFMTKLSNLLSSTAFIILEVIALLAVCAYLGLMLFRNVQRNKARARRRAAAAGKRPPVKK
ncbi:MAG: D-alanyl-D-alanine carboxypeptidase [Clostridia bacterium]|nr:D-alanyl-D-alanine carboxypeptidase [Clostridia bacterium]